MSATTSASSANGTTTPNTSAQPNANGTRSHLKMATSGKALDGARKQAGSPLDGPQRKPSTHKAWTQGTNPLTQRSSTPNTANGAANTPKPAPSAKSQASFSKETNTPEKHAHDRLTFLLANFMGLPCNVTVKSGEQYTGIFSGASLETPELRYVLKLVKRTKPSNEQANGVGEPADDYVGVGENYTMAFDIRDVVDLACSNVSTDRTHARAPNGTSSSFKTDTDISGNLAIRERTLQRWEPASDSNIDLSLEDSGKSGWDQFEANERLYGLKSNYDENIYTTTIDRNNPLYKQRAAAAEKIAREIEAGSALTTHVAEERGRAFFDDSGADEEDKYSGVRRDFPPLQSGQPNRYTPPARRPPTGQPTVPGAPVDPAIISSQIARPGQPSASMAQSQNALPTQGSDVTGTQQAQESPVGASTKPQDAASGTGAAQAPSAAANTSSEAAHKVPTPAATAAQKTDAETTASSSTRRAGRPDNATATVEHDVLDSFKQFSALEKMRVQERQRHAARQEKSVKLNELKKFAQNFKLNTPVPSDLVPILAKDKEKQSEIVEKALRNVEEAKSTPLKAPVAAASATDPRVSRPGAPRFDNGLNSPVTPGDRQNLQRGRPAQGTFATPARGERPVQAQNSPMPSRTGPGQLSQRLAAAQQQHKANISHPVPAHELRIPSAGAPPPANGLSSPTSSVSTRFNAHAMEFRPNPAANTFTPSQASTGSSPRVDSAARPEPPRRVTTTSFFATKKPNKSPDRPSIDEAFDPLERMKKEVEADSSGTKRFVANGGIPEAYRTLPTWDVPEANRDKTYNDMFAKPPTAMPSISPSHNGLANGPIPHQHQLPLHLQQGAHGMQQAQTPQHTPRHLPVQPFHGPSGPHHYDEHRMQFTPSSSSVHPSPRAMPQFIYPAQGPQSVPLYSQAMPTFVSHNGQAVALRPPPGAQFVGPQPAPMGGHMMISQASSGPFVGVPMNAQMQPYSPMPGHVYPHNAQMPPQPGPNGFPSPRPGAPMMSHQGSQQGHAPQQIMYMQQPVHGPMFPQNPSAPMTPMRGPYPQPHQGHYAASPHQQLHFPQQQPHRGTPSASYAQPMLPSHSMPPQGPPPSGPALHGPDGGEEVK